MEHVSTMLPAFSFQDQSGYSLVCSVPSRCQCVKILIRVFVAVPQIFQRYAGAALLSRSQFYSIAMQCA